MGTLLFMIFAPSAASSLLADARSGGITGPGVDVFVQTPAPGPGERIDIEIVGRGGGASGIRHATVSDARGRVLAKSNGRGVWWGRMLRSQTRGHDAVTASFVAPDDATTLDLTITAAYVIARPSGSLTFSNESLQDTVSLRVRLLGAQERWIWSAVHWLVPLLWWAGWFVVLRIGFALWERIGPEADGDDFSFLTPMSFLGLGGLVGYWTSVRPVMDALGLSGEWLSALFVLAWALLPWALILRQRNAS